MKGDWKSYFGEFYLPREYTRSQRKKERIVAALIIVPNILYLLWRLWVAVLPAYGF